jgi:hypothetical protein
MKGAVNLVIWSTVGFGLGKLNSSRRSRRGKFE